MLEIPSLPLIRKAGGGFSANTEGWALYAEQLCDEMGLYEADPLGRLGLLQSLLFRAARCVVDTGLHAKGWSRERAIDYMVSTTGENGTAMSTEVERYCTWPGQACSYKVGHTRWLKLRAEARRRLGAKFDIRDFHDVGLTAAPMPLSVLEQAQRELVCLPGYGMSVLEMSHRSEGFLEVLATAKRLLKELLAIPDNYQIIFLQGASRLQFSMVPLNLMRGQPQPPDYLLTGSWSKMALEEAKREGKCNVAWDGSDSTVGVASFSACCVDPPPPDPPPDPPSCGEGNVCEVY